jgi:hypothetical protein
MKEITIQLGSLVSNFAGGMTDFLFDYNNDPGVTPAEAQDQTEPYIRDLRILLGAYSTHEEVLSTIRKLFKEGHSCMLLGSKFEEVEACYTKEEEFCLVVKKIKKTVCILCLDEMSW